MTAEALIAFFFILVSRTGGGTMMPVLLLRAPSFIGLAIHQQSAAMGQSSRSQAVTVYMQMTWYSFGRLYPPQFAFATEYRDFINVRSPEVHPRQPAAVVFPPPWR